MGKVKVKEVYEKDADNPAANPILVRFQHADGSRGSSSLDLNQLFRTALYTSDPSASPHKDFSHLNRPKNFGGTIDQKPIINRERQLVALQSSAMTYIGTTPKDEEPLRTYMALRQGKKMKVYEVTPITVAPFIKGHSHVVEEERVTQVKKSQAEKKEAKIDLIKSFGSKRKRLTYERLEKNQIDVLDMNESMTKASAQIKASEEEPKIKDESVLTLIPPCNREAESPEGVYNLEDIISLEEMDDLEDLAYQFLDLTSDVIKEWQASKKFSDYFFAMWNRLSIRKSDVKAVYCAKVVLYTELLICLLKLRHEHWRKKTLDISEVFPAWLQEKALESFTAVNAKGIRYYCLHLFGLFNRNRPDTLKDKTCCYVMVLVLLANDFIFDVQLMSTSLNIHIKKLLTLAKAVGISLHYNAATKEHRGMLRVPMPKPIETRGRRRALR